ncbi:hypothetical protein A9978_25890 [Pseudomonas sp. UMC65]|uniref:hypothetical protein n=1 Tax=Pseudomonas TaxID=286 RepID=UPI001600214F|nr:MULTISPECIES: hypothetical protein [unclassified Pseudomonas]MBB1615889.1 hypothetical protein [Pseudomonas sp. UMC65]MBB1620370.1 hypothetical protein [Pseudomonas sp. UME65]MDT9642154.1 hypothetical protein [Pseudomonas sp. JV245A]
MVRLLIMVITATIIGVAVYFQELKFSYSDFKDYCNTLLSISGMVFTIMGIWIAFVYPNAIKRLQDPDKIKIADFTATMQDTRRLESIVGSIMESGAVAISITLIYLGKLLITGLPAYLEYRDAVRAASVAVIMFLTFVQCSAVFSVIYANYLFIDDLHTRREAQERNADIR